VIPVHAAPIPTASTHFLNFGEVVIGDERVLPIELGNAGDQPWVILPGEIVVRDIAGAVSAVLLR
jgi:hypothetical protein